MNSFDASKARMRLRGLSLYRHPILEVCLGTWIVSQTGIGPNVLNPGRLRLLVADEVVYFLLVHLLHFLQERRLSLLFWRHF